MKLFNTSITQSEASWTATIHCKVSPANEILYRIRIYVEGLLGTHLDRVSLAFLFVCTFVSI